MTGAGKHIITLMAALLVLAAGQNAYAGPEWKLKRSEEGIKVYTANTEGSNFKSVKVECTVNARLSQLIAFLMDIDRQPSWVYGSKNAKLLRKTSPLDIAFHSEVEVPWPCSNRDYIAHITVNQPAPNLVTIDSHSEPDMIPEETGKVRVRRSVAHWDITAPNAQQVNIVYTVEFDPAGSVPAWLINMFVVKGPFQSFQKLREGVSRAPYVTAHAEQIKDYL